MLALKRGVPGSSGGSSGDIELNWLDSRDEFGGYGDFRGQAFSAPSFAVHSAFRVPHSAFERPPSCFSAHNGRLESRRAGIEAAGREGRFAVPLPATASCLPRRSLRRRRVPARRDEAGFPNPRRPLRSLRSLRLNYVRTRRYALRPRAWSRGSGRPSFDPPVESLWVEREALDGEQGRGAALPRLFLCQMRDLPAPPQAL